MSGSELRVYNYEPAAITPGQAADQNAVIVVRQIYKGLVEFDHETGAPVNLIAESITSPDNRVWTIKVRPGFAFSNGEPVTADSFIDAWTYLASGPDEQVNRGFFERVAELRRKDGWTFEVTLSAPYSGFPAMLGYCAFFPMAREHLDDPAAHHDRPIGNGQYAVDAWEHEAFITLRRNDGWGGPPARTDRLVFRMYKTLEEGYAGFEAGQHDLMDNLPAEKYSEVRRKYPDTVFEQASNSFSYLGIPLYVPAYRDPRVRQALSLAIDRQAIIDKVYDGQYLPAAGVISPNFLGYRADAGAFCRFDPQQARDLLAAAGGWTGGRMVLHSNIGGGHEPWLTMVGDQLREHLGIDYELRVDRPFAAYFAQAKERGYEGMFRRAWAPDYAWAESYLFPIFGQGGSANQQFYDNQAFDALVAHGDRAADLAEGVRWYQQAEDVVLTDMPIIPLWFQKTSVLYSKRVQRYVRNIINGTDYAAIEVG